MNRLLTLFAVVVFSTTLFCQAFDWEWQNSKPHSNELRAIKIIAPNTIVGFAAAGTVQKSTDNGATWDVTYVDPSGRAFRSAYFVNSSLGFACGTDGLLMKTVDGGGSFTALSPGTTVQLNDVSFVDADTGYIGGASGTLLKTTDGGTNWTVITTTSITTAINAVSTPSADHIYIGCASSGATIRLSTDFGVSWQDVSPVGYTGQTIWDICFVDANRGWFVYQYLGGVYRTTDAGTSWTLSNTTSVVVNNSVTFKDTTNGYITDNIAGSVYRSTDGGATWSPIDAAGKEPQYATDCSGSLVFSVGRAGTCYKSTDGGATFFPSFISATTTQIRQVKFLNVSTGLAGEGSTTVADSSGFLIKTTDGGNTWNKLPYNFKHQVNSLWLASSDVWYVGRGRNAIFKTTDGGSTFFQQTQPLSGTSQFYDIAFSDVNNGYAFSAGGGIVKTTDGGTNWVSANTPFGTTAVYNGVVFDANKVIAVGGSAKAYVTTNGGTNWNALSPGIPGNFFAVRFYDANFGVIAGFNSPSPVASKTTDGGATWIPLTLPSPSGFDGNSIWGIGFKDANTFWLTGINGLVGYTTDGGSTWTVAKKVTANTVFSAAVVGNDMWLSGDRGTMLKGFSDPTIQEIKKFNLTALIEGFYDGSNMVPDSVTVELHEANSPYGVVETAQAVLNSNGQGTTDFIKYAKSSTPYYIVIKHRNAVETWSKTPQSFSGGTLDYDFTTAATQAYGDNLKLKLGNYCIFSGDVNQDGTVDLSDLIEVDNDNANFVTGYVPSDVDGNLSSDLSDMIIVDNNNAAFVGKVTP